MESGGPTQMRRSPLRAAGRPPIFTLGEPATTGPPTCGTLAVTLGQTCIDVNVAAGFPMKTSFLWVRLHILAFVRKLSSLAGVIFGSKSPNKLFKSDSQRVAFLPCVVFSV